MNPDDALAGRIIKVNHAGEHGAVSIYAGQMAVARFRAKEMLAELVEFKAHEVQHRAIFAAELQRRGLPRCRSYWLCAGGGYVLGIVSGILGVQAMAITTVAVERVVLRHLGHQLDSLAGRDHHAVKAIAAIFQDEQQHHDRATRRVLHVDAFHEWLGRCVSAATESVIWIGMRLS